MLKNIMRLSLGISLLTLTSSLALASPVEDVSAWSKRFEDAIRSSDFEEMQRLITSASDPRLKMEHLFEPMIKEQSGLRIISVEQFNNQDLGSFYKRRNFAVLFEHNITFYTIEFCREVDGWQILGFGAGGDVNQILARRWPG